MYANICKRVIDFLVAFISLIVLSPLLVLFTIIGSVAMGGNPFFLQYRPGKKGYDGQEKIFQLIKFRTMNNKKDIDGNLLPDEKRLTSYGRFLRNTSLDELPELINILKGDMSLVGPRPLLVRDMLFMTDAQRRRHTVRPGLTGYAQINGRNNISWEQKLYYDVQYIDQGITLVGDLNILFHTIGIVLRASDIVRDGTVSDLDLGDWLLQKGTVNQNEYKEKQKEAKKLLEKL